MRQVTLLLMVLAAAPIVAKAQGGLQIAPSRMDQFAGRPLLDYSDARQHDVPRPKGINADLYLIRLYELPEMGGCEGTDETCLRHYALLLAAGGMPPDVVLYDLGSVGEITDIKWIASPPRDTLQRAPLRILGRVDEATLLVTVQNYPSSVLASSSELHREVKRYRLSAGIDRVTVEEVH